MIEARRQTLRDLPQAHDVNTAATADQLKAIWPDELKQKTCVGIEVCKVRFEPYDLAGKVLCEVPRTTSRL